jgi:hypothetical protein
MSCPPGKIKCSERVQRQLLTPAWTGLRRKRSRGSLALARSDRCRAPILSGPLLIRGFGVRVPGGAPLLA